MLKKLAAIGLRTSIAFAPIVLTPAAAMAQAGPPVLANPLREGVITGGRAAKPKVVVRPANAKAANCTREAAANGLSGKPRKKFITECKRNLAAE